MRVALGQTAGQVTGLHLKPTTIQWTRSHVEHHGDTDIFPNTFRVRVDLGQLVDANAKTL